MHKDNLQREFKYLSIIQIYKFTNIEIIQSVFSEYEATEIEFNYRKKMEETFNRWKLTKAFLSINWITEKIKKEIKSFLESNDNGGISGQHL